ncbi:hypothetical protein NDU88_003778 [Pleurodeles waltl]|uniref:Uncharacterized protein n=1 Tax=Pleurodeles waltl TaxID=8319 RepID=A0AAV7W6E0_PLEWA|nr:hypothetical protein NDU88_003778 [Pleurodeles waltl]
MCRSVPLALSAHASVLRARVSGTARDGMKSRAITLGEIPSLTVPSISGPELSDPQTPDQMILSPEAAALSFMLPRQGRPAAGQPGQQMQ